MATLAHTLDRAIENAQHAAYAAIGVLEALDERGELPEWVKDQVVNILTQSHEAQFIIATLRERMEGTCH